MAKVYPTAYLADKLIPIEQAGLSVASSAVMYGLSVYTVVRLRATQHGTIAFRLKDHYQRLINSARIIGIDTFESQWDFAKFTSTIRAVIAANQLTLNAYLRITVHVVELVPGTRSRGLTTTVSMFVYDADPILPPEGARIKTSVWRRIPDYSIPSRAKVNGAYINSVLAKQDALDSGYDDCLFLDSAGHVCELSAANIFMVRDGVLITPSLTSDILEGITRRTVIEIAKTQQIPLVERDVDLTELYIADELFACGTSSDITPIIEVDARLVGQNKIGPITQQMSERYAQMIRPDNPGLSQLVTKLSD